MKSILRQMKKEYKESCVLPMFPKIATIVKSRNSRESYSSLSGCYNIINRDFESSIITKKNDPSIEQKAKILAKEPISFQEELVFSLLDQSYSPIGTYGYWKYKEKFDVTSFRFRPVINIDETGRLIGMDRLPLFCTHIDTDKQKLCKNISTNELSLQNYMSAKKLLLKWNNIEDSSNHTFSLIINPELEKIARGLKKEKFDLIIYPNLKNLKWALMLEDVSKPLVFQLRKEPDFEIIEKSSTFADNEIALCVDMRCNVGINDWKKIIGHFEEKEEKFSTLREWNDYRIPNNKYDN